MPKRKAVGPVDSSDGEDDDQYYSYPTPQIQPSFSKPSLYNNLHRPSSPKRIPGAGPSLNFGGDVGGGGGGSHLSITGQPNKPFFGLPVVNQSPIKSSLATVPSGPFAAKKPRGQEFSRNMKDLNKAFVSTLRATVSKNPSHSLIPLVKDYMYHSRVIIEQHKKGDGPGELVNGITSPTRSFKSLGEYFEDFEQKIIDGERGSRNSSGESSLRLTNSDNSSTLSSGTSGGSNASFTFNTSSSSPSKPATDNVKIGQPFSLMGTSPLKSNSLTASPVSLSSTNLSMSTPKSIAPSFTPGSLTTSASPLKSLSTLTSTAQPFKSSTPVSSNSSPPKTTPFTGFSFFTPPPVVPNLNLGTNSSSTSAPEKTEGKDNGEDDAEDDEPPKVEFTSVTEDDAIYSIRCKVFGIIDGNLKDKGIGMLYLKKVDGGKHQIVVRADNNLGTVILNILLQKSLPLDKNSKNSVMTVDLQGNKGKAMPIILKVKTEENAAELLEKLKECQKQAS